MSQCSVTASGGGTCLADGSGLANPHTNYGALVMGPDVADQYTDDRPFHSMTGVHLLNNAGFSGQLQAYASSFGMMSSSIRFECCFAVSRCNLKQPPMLTYNVALHLKATTH